MALLYVPRGTESISEDDGEYLGTFRQHYFDVAMAIRPEVRVGPLAGYLVLGGSWGLLLNATRYGAASGMTDDITDGLRRHDVALLVGVGVALQLPPARLGPFRLDTVSLEGRYNRGLLNIDPDADERVRNRSTSLMLGVSFALGSKTAAATPTTSASRAR